MMRLAILTCCAAILVAAGGGATAHSGPAASARGSGTTDGLDPQKAALAGARARWRQQRLSSYRFRLEVLCFCPGSGKASRITVRRGRASGSDGAQEPVDTVPKMFRLIAEALDDPNAGDVTVRYHPKLGFPTAASVDRIELAIDDEISWSADRMRRLGR